MSYLECRWNKPWSSCCNFFCKKYSCSENHKFRFNYFWTCDFHYINIFCKKKLQLLHQVHFKEIYNDCISQHLDFFDIFWKKIQRLDQVQTSQVQIQMDRAIAYVIIPICTFMFDAPRTNDCYAFLARFYIETFSYQWARLTTLETVQP